MRESRSLAAKDVWGAEESPQPQPVSEAPPDHAVPRQIPSKPWQSAVSALRRGLVQVYGCTPGCLLWSIALSVGLTIVVNLLIRLF